MRALVRVLGFVSLVASVLLALPVALAFVCVCIVGVAVLFLIAGSIDLMEGR